MQRSVYSGPYISVNELRHEVYPFIVNYGKQAFVDKWIEIFGDRNVYQNTCMTELNIVVMAALEVEPEHKKRYGKKAANTGYTATMRSMKMRAKWEKMFPLPNGKKYPRTDMMNMEYRALARSAFIKRIVDGTAELPTVSTQQSKVLQNSTSKDTTPTQHQESLLVALQFYYRFLKGITDIKELAWFRDVEFSFDKDNKFTTFTISSELLQKCSSAIDNITNDAKRSEIAEKLSISDVRVIDQILDLMKQAK